MSLRHMATSYFVSIATILGTGILALPVKLYDTGYWPFAASFSVSLLAQLLIATFMIELLQWARFGGRINIGHLRENTGTPPAIELRPLRKRNCSGMDDVARDRLLEGDREGLQAGQLGGLREGPEERLTGGLEGGLERGVREDLGGGIEGRSDQVMEEMSEGTEELEMDEASLSRPLIPDEEEGAGAEQDQVPVDEECAANQTGSSVAEGHLTLAKGPSLHMLSGLYLGRFGGWVFSAAALLHFYSILISYVLAWSKAFCSVGESPSLSPPPPGVHAWLPHCFQAHSTAMVAARRLLCSRRHRSLCRSF